MGSSFAATGIRIVSLVGIWFIVAPFVLAHAAQPREMWTSLIGGAIALVLSGYLTLRVLPRVATAK